MPLLPTRPARPVLSCTRYPLLLVTFLLLLVTGAGAQLPDSVTMTPHRDLKLHPVRLEVPEKFRDVFDTTHVVNLPQGYTARVFWVGGLEAPRFMTWGPDSVLYVASFVNARIFALPDKNHDGVADTAIMVAESAWGHDMKFHDGAMYLAMEDRVMKLRDLDGDGYYEDWSTFIDSIGLEGALPVGGHVTRTIVFDSVNGKLYYSVGSSCNVCRETGRGIIEQYNIDGTGRRVYASGARNAVGMAIHPRTGRLWATNNGSDMQGNDIPPEWIDLVREDGFYGWPIAYANGLGFDYFDFTIPEYDSLLPITAADSARVGTMLQPAALIQAHSAPMAIEFPDTSFPTPYRRGAFVALRGSYNRYPAVGASIVYLDFDDDDDTVANYVADFMTGMMPDSLDPTTRWARPVGLESDSRGQLYVSTNEANAIIIITPTEEVIDVSSVRSAPDVAELGLRSVGPNPFRSSTTIGYTLAERGRVRLSLVDAMGRTVRTLADRVEDPGSYSIMLDGRDLAEGLYFCRLESPHGTQVRPVTLMK